MTARAAAAYLDVKPATLYAYVSRGLVRSVPGANARERLYAFEDLERLRARHDARSGHGPVAASAMRYGEPVLDSALTYIDDAGPHYCGRSALALAASGVAFEAVAELLWTGSSPTAPVSWRVDAPRVDPKRLAACLPAAAPPLLALQLAVPALAAADEARFDVREDVEIVRARALVPQLAAFVALARDASLVEEALRVGSVAAALARATGVRAGAEQVTAIDRTLVLCADHELNMSAFAARVTASSGADLYACVAAGLAALSGPLHGALSDRVEALVAEAGRADRAHAVVRDRMRRGEDVPGFGHPIYRAGDPRATALLELATSLAPRNPIVRTTVALAEAMRELREEYANLDTGLVAVRAALKMDRGAAVVLFAIGRAAGWIAHAFEQRRSGAPLRPRARYTGPTSQNRAR